MNTNWQVSPREIVSMGPVIPVMVIEDADQAVPLARALLAGGIRVLEITLRTPAALEAIRVISDEVEEAMVGAGTVLTPKELEQVAAAGGRFALSPGQTPDLLKAALDSPIGLIPGISTASELMSGLALGYAVFKFFPAEASGGTKALKAIGGPFPEALFCPTGGISPDNCGAYLALDNVACVGGSWLVPAEAVRAGDWDRITRLAAQAATMGVGSG